MKIIPNMGIKLSDGTRLSARVWMSDGEKSEPKPAILEYLPYRKSDGTAVRDHAMHAFYAENGYVAIRVDRRGCGDSEGLFDDEYSKQELDDGVEIINWISAQPWCDGNIGIQGISWGGFNGLQLAARAPEPLKAVISIGTTVDRYHDDIHYKGGIQLAENIGWAATAMSWLSTPGHPDLVGETWREDWLKRLEKTPDLLTLWSEQADRSNYWKPGSICEDYSKVKAACLVIGGQHDGYRNAPMAALTGISAPVKSILGPWSHKYPHISTIGPSIDFLGEALRWWDRWLKGMDTGVEQDPDYRAYVNDSIQPKTALDYRPGHWVGLNMPISETCKTHIFHLSDKCLGKTGQLTRKIKTDLHIGKQAGEFFPFGLGSGELPDNQSADDAHSVTFDSEPLTEAIDLIGAPSIKLRITSDQPRAHIIARLCDLRPDGTSALIALGFLNLRHRNGFEAKEDLVPGAEYDVTLTFDQSAYNLPAGHCFRISLSNSYWPFCWPEADDATITLIDGKLTIPVLDSHKALTVSFDPPRDIPARPTDVVSQPYDNKTRTTDDDTGTESLRIIGNHGRFFDPETQMTTESQMDEIWSISPSDPNSAHADITWERSLSGQGADTSTTVHAKMWADADAFHTEQTLTARIGSQQVFAKTWRSTVKR